MENNVIICTLGTRDLKLSREPDTIGWLKLHNLEYRPAPDGLLELKNVRQACELLLNNYKTCKEWIRWPIILPGLEFINEKSGLNRETPVKFIIISTDQSADNLAADRHKRNDTFYMGELLKHWMKLEYGHLFDIYNIPVTGNLVELDTQYKNLWPKLVQEAGIKKDMHCWLLLQGGIDAINTAVLLRAIAYFDKAPEYLTLPEGETRPLQSVFPRQVLLSSLRSNLLNSLENENYSAISQMGRKVSDSLCKLADLMQSILLLDFQKSRKIIDKLKTDLPLRKTAREIDRHFHPDDKFFRQQALMANILWQDRRNAWSSFILRVFTLAENILKPRVEEYLGEEVLYDENSGHEQWNRLLAKNPELLNYLNSVNINRGTLRTDIPGRLVYKFILKYAREHGRPELFTATEETLFNKLNQLSLLRNEIAHYLEGISKDKIEGKLNGKLKPFLDELSRFLKMKEFHIKDIIIETMRQLILTE